MKKKKENTSKFSSWIIEYVFPSIMQMICHIKFTFFSFLGKEVFFIHFYWRFQKIKKGRRHIVNYQYINNFAHELLMLKYIYWACEIYILWWFPEFKFPHSVSFYIIHLWLSHLPSSFFYTQCLSKRKHNNIVRQDLRSRIFSLDIT